MYGGNEGGNCYHEGGNHYQGGGDYPPKAECMGLNDMAEKFPL